MVGRVIQQEFSISHHPAHISRILHDLRFSVQRPRKILAQADKALQTHWVRHRFPAIKKSQNRESRYPFRGRSFLPTRSHPLPNLGPRSGPAGYPHHRPEKHPQNLRNY
jgi:hypothetical protein